MLRIFFNEFSFNRNSHGLHNVKKRLYSVSQSLGNKGIKDAIFVWSVVISESLLEKKTSQKKQTQFLFEMDDKGWSCNVFHSIIENSCA